MIAVYWCYWKTEDGLKQGPASRLATIDGDDGNTGVKPQHLLLHLPTVAPSLTCRLDFFYSNTNNCVQLEDTTIKTERCCSTQRTERTTAVHHSRGLHCPDQISCTAGLK